ncbi:hypothetical protein A3K73_02825 [Candidatus Pacearchaeota archaeon RBG_13_36_9]|nr:MAG: hypothetical protein A3K73_02825 [Candidatus Pacearchaeota archaeon RBG_13_36_9]
MKNVIEQGEIAKLRSDSGVGGISGEMHLVRHDGKKYALRICLDEKRAEDYSALYYNMEKHGFFPKLLYREGKHFLFEFIEGRDCTLKDGPEIAYEVGKIFALVNSIPTDNLKTLNADKKFFSDLDFLLKQGIIDNEKHEEIKQLHEALRGKADLKMAAEISDCIPSNFRISNGKVFLVDIEAIRYRFKGRGIAKAFLRWFKKNEERTKFIEGYSSVAPVDFLTESHLKFSYLYYLVINTRFKLETKKTYSENLKQLDLLLKGKLN